VTVRERDREIERETLFGGVDWTRKRSSDGRSLNETTSLSLSLSLSLSACYSNWQESMLQSSRGRISHTLASAPKSGTRAPIGRRHSGHSVIDEEVHASRLQ